MTMKYLDIPMLGGVNQLNDESDIKDSELVEAQNLYPVRKGHLSLRPSMQHEQLVLKSEMSHGVPARVLGDSAEMHALNGGDYLNVLPYVPLDFEFARFGGSFVVVYVDPATGQGYLDVLPKPSGAPAQVSLGEVSERPHIFVWNDVIYVLTGNMAQVGWKVVRSAANTWGYAIEPIQFTNESAAFPKFGVPWQGRVWYGNMGPGYASMLFFTEASQPEVLSGAGDHFNRVNGWNIELPGNEPITGMAVVSPSPAAIGAQSALFVFTRSSAFQLTGQPLTSAEAISPAMSIINTLTVTKLAVEAGCASQATIVHTPYGTLWASEDDVWMLSWGSLPVRVGGKIKEALRETPPGLLWRWHAAYEDGCYKLAIFAAGQGPNHTSACQAQYWLDLRTGAPQSPEDALWWGPQKFVPSNAEAGTFCLRRDTRPGEQARVLGLTTYRFGSRNSSGDFVAEPNQGLAVVSFTGKAPYDQAAPQGQLRAWRSNQAYYEGDEVVTAPYGDICRYVCTSAGVSGTVEPAWNAATYTDGTVGWTSALSTAFPAFEPVNLQVGSDIIPRILTKEYGSDTGTVEKLVGDVELGYWIDRPVRIRVTRLTDYDSRTVTSLPPAGGYTLDEFPELTPPDEMLTPLPSDLGGPTYTIDTENTQGRLLKIKQRRLLGPTPWQRVIGTTFQLDLTTEPGIYYPAEYTKLVALDLRGDLSFTQQVELNLTGGWYDSLDDVVAEFNDLVAASALPYARYYQIQGTALVPSLYMFINYTYVHGWDVPVFLPGLADDIPSPPYTVTDANRYSNAFFLRLLGFTDYALGYYFDRQITSAKQFSRQTLNPALEINTLKLRYRMFGRRSV